MPEPVNPPNTLPVQEEVKPEINAPETSQMSLNLGPFVCAVCGNTTNYAEDFHYDRETNEYFCPRCGDECAHCGNICKRTDMVKKDNHWYCADCFITEFPKCPNCKERVEKDEILPPTSANRWSMKLGGCTECSVRCSSCNRVVDKDNVYTANNENYCEDCYSEYFTSCESCGDTLDRDNAIYVEDQGDYCSQCYNDKFFICPECEETFTKSDGEEIDGQEYCPKCFEKLKPSLENTYGPLLGLKEFNYNKKSRLINKLEKLVPISIKDLKTKYPNIAQAIPELIAFSKGKEITENVLNDFKATLEDDVFPVDYTQWDSELQRSISTLKRDRPVEEGTPQLVLNILASNKVLTKLKENPALYDLFDKINTLSNHSDHPYVLDQMGWARLELDPNKEFILVDEIQSDHSNATFKIKQQTSLEIKADKVKEDLKKEFNKEGADLEKFMSNLRFDEIENSEKIKEGLKSKYNLDDRALKIILMGLDRRNDDSKVVSGLKAKYKLDTAGINNLLDQLNAITKDFPDIANQAITQFAKTNGYKKIYWHTYESGMKLKNNTPPRSLYEKVPKEHFFEPTDDKPFGLEGNFLARQASKKVISLARKFAAKYLK